MLLAQVQGYICDESHVLTFKTKVTRHAWKSSSFVVSSPASPVRFLVILNLILEV